MTHHSKSYMPCNKPRKSNRPGKKRMVKACSGGKEKIIHYGATGYGHNYSTAARKSFRARHKCDTAKDKLSARYWACKDLWTRGGSRKNPPPGRIGKYKSHKKSRSRRKSRSRKKSRRKSRSRKKSRRKSRSRKKKSSSRKRRSRR